MKLIEYFRRQFAYDAWSNREVMSAIRAQAGENERTLQLMSHIVAAEGVWLDRLEQQPQGVPVWPKPDLGWCEAQVAELARLWTEYCSGLPTAIWRAKSPTRTAKARRGRARLKTF